MPRDDHTQSMSVRTDPDCNSCDFLKKNPEYKSCNRCCGIFEEDYLSLSQIKVGHCDKLQDKIVQIYLCGEDYKIYRTWQGVRIHFSDCRHREREQRQKYTQIFNKLSHLRFLTSQLLVLRDHRRRSGGFYDNEIAEAICLAMEDRTEEANETLDRGIELATNRNTNENRVRYLGACLGVALLLVFLLWGLYLLSSLWPLLLPPNSHGLLLAAGAGALGAVFSIGTRVQQLKLHPCEQSAMNYFMGALRVLIGFASGALILLLATCTDIGKSIKDLFDIGIWHGIALLGFFGGFAERLVPFLLGKLDSREGSRTSHDRGKTATSRAATSTYLAHRSPEHSH